MSKQVNYNENLVAGAAIRDDKGRRISKLFEAPHPKMTVGYAKNLIMPNDPTEQEFNFRQSGGGVIEDGVAVIDKVKGNSVVWNQLMKFGASTKTDNGITYEIKEDGRIHIYGTATAQSTVTYYDSVGAVISGHKYIVVITNNIISGEANGLMPSIGTQGGIVNCNQSGTTPVWFFRVQNGVTIDVTFRPQLIDITQMFGTGNEPTTYEEFLRRKPKVSDEYAYNKGTIVNNKVEKVVTTGRNLCPYLEQGTLNIYNGSEQPNTTRVRTPFIPISNKHSYCTMLNKWAIRNGCFYDRDKNFISSGYPSVSTGVLDSSAIPANTAFCRLIYSAQNGTDVVTPSYDVFMFAVGNATIPTTKYEPYEEHTLDLAWVKDIKDAEGVKLFEGGMRSAGTAFDEVGKNKAVKRFGSVDLGTLEWNTSWWDDDGRIYVSLDNKKAGATNILYPLGLTYKSDSLLINKIGICGNLRNNYIYVGDAKTHSSASEFISSLSGVYAYYELAEPIEVEYDEKSLTYPVVAGGTEEAIASESSSAFRADIGYGIDAVKTILDLKARVEALEGK